MTADGSKVCADLTLLRSRSDPPRTDRTASATIAVPIGDCAVEEVFAQSLDCFLCFHRLFFDRVGGLRSAPLKRFEVAVFPEENVRVNAAEVMLEQNERQAVIVAAEPRPFDFGP